MDAKVLVSVPRQAVKIFFILAFECRLNRDGKKFQIGDLG